MWSLLADFCCGSGLLLLSPLSFVLQGHRFHLRPWVTSIGLHQRSLFPLQGSGVGFSALAPSIIICGSLWTPVPLVAFFAEIH